MGVLVREVAVLYELFELYFKKLAKAPEVREKRIRVNVVGRWREFFPASLARTIDSLVDDTKHEYVIRHEYNVGVATDTVDGLTVPVVKHVDRLSVLQIAAEVQRLTEAARARKIALEDLKGGTFTITSAGSIGGILATPILNYPEVAILGVYRIQEKPVVRGGQIVIRKMTNFTITLDHRIVDGATAARFLNEMMRFLTNPGLLLLEGA